MATSIIKSLNEQLKNKSLSVINLKTDAIAKANKYQSDYNAFVTITDCEVSSSVTNILSGIPYSLKDNFSTKGILTTASSNILKNYIPSYDATVVKKLNSLGAVLIGKTVLDELAMGGSGTTGHTGIVKNPYDKDRLIGGSSAGSAASVALGIVPYSIGSDTGDSIRKPAGYAGVVGYKPTYGLISRHGLFPFACSLDTVGVITKSVMDAAIVVNEIKGKDLKDMTSVNSENIDLIKNIDSSIKGKKLFYIKEICDKSSYEETDDELDSVLSNFEGLLSVIKKEGVIVEGVSIDKTLLNALYPSYMTISSAEATSNNANLTGLIFGERALGKNVDEVVFNSRTNGFSELIKRRFILGSYVLQKENQEKLYLNAKRVRRMIVDVMNDLFSRYDALIMPSSGFPPKFNEKADVLSDKYLLLENHLVIGNFGGFPSITIPYKIVNKLPLGINLTSRVLSDDKIMNLAHSLEGIIDFKGVDHFE